MARRAKLWEPNSQPQYDFCNAIEDELFYGGSKGGAKSDAILFKSLRQIHLASYKALILRQSFPEVQELIDRSHRIFPLMSEKPKWNGELKRWQFPVHGSGPAIIKFGHCKSVDEVKQFHGQEWPYIGFDEAADVEDENVWINLLAEIRCPNPNVKRQGAATGNPGRPGHGWCKRRWIDKCGKSGQRIYRYHLTLPSGEVVYRTRRFIPAKVTDNPVYANDPVYMANLLSLPEILRRQLLYGDWDAGFGLALDELDEAIHFVPSFNPPAHWRCFGSFDWGYSHPWVFGWYCLNEDGLIFKQGTLRGRLMSDRRIIERIKHHVPWERLKYIVAGHDVRSVYKARRDDRTPSTAETFAKDGLFLTNANIARHGGLKNFREQLAWKGIEAGNVDGEPNFYWMDTPENHKAFERIQMITIDPDDAEDALKVNADPVTGEGGDDDFDETRYALASRPIRSMPTWQDVDIRAFSKSVLQHEMETGRRHRSKVLPNARKVLTDGQGY